MHQVWPGSCQSSRTIPKAVLIHKSPELLRLTSQLAAAGVRVDTHLRNEKLGFNIREAQLAKISAMVVMGDKEKDSATVAPRKSNGDQLAPLSVGAFVDKIKEECGPQLGAVRSGACARQLNPLQSVSTGALFVYEWGALFAS